MRHVDFRYNQIVSVKCSNFVFPHMSYRHMTPLSAWQTSWPGNGFCSIHTGSHKSFHTLSPIEHRPLPPKKTLGNKNVLLLPVEIKYESLWHQFGLERGGRDVCGQVEDAYVELLLVDVSHLHQLCCMCVQSHTFKRQADACVSISVLLHKSVCLQVYLCVLHCSLTKSLDL